MRLDAKPDNVRNVASVYVGVALPGGLLAGSGAVATVAKAQHAGWLVGDHVGDAQRGEGGERELLVLRVAIFEDSKRTYSVHVRRSPRATGTERVCPETRVCTMYGPRHLLSACFMWIMRACLRDTAHTHL